MSIVGALARKRTFRIVALPLTTASRTPNSDPQLTYYHFATPSPEDATQNSWMNWATRKSSELWAGFGKAKEGTWKRKTFVYGERLVDRIDFEELALKSLDTSLGPTIQSLLHAQTNQSVETPTIPLLYPPSACDSPTAHLRALLAKRTPRHRKGFWMWMAIAPLTAPFAIVPIIPNLPFFFCVWRSWSHWRAYKASAYLEDFLKRDAIIPQESKELDKVYFDSVQSIQASSKLQETNSPSKPADLDSDASSTSTSSEKEPPSESKQTQTGPGPNDSSGLLLTRDAVPELEKVLGLDPNSSFSTEVYRALEQARMRIQDGKAQR